MKTVHLIQHTHWDREWYFTENDSKALLFYFMEDLLTRMEQDPSTGPFVLDGQTVMLEDYFSVAPANRQRLAALIEAGRILIGPWYTQTDFLVVGAESITRNLLLGMADCAEFGAPMPVGYVPDSFGQSAQLPMFLQQFAIDSAVIWRGWCEHDVASSEFHWRSDNGSQVTTAVLPWGYGCAKWLPTESESAWPKLQEVLAKQARFSQADHLLLPNGNDQSPFEFQIPAMLAQLNQQQDQYRFVTSSFVDYFKGLATSDKSLPVYQGELLSPKYMRIHRGIFSTRVDIKLLNAKLENTLSQTLEPLLALNWQLGLPYPQHAVDGIWRQAMQSHAHDSIGGCNSDRVNRMVKNRLESGLEMAEQLIDLNMKMLSEGISAEQQGKKVIIFNALPQNRQGLVALTVYTPEAHFRIVDAAGQPCPLQILEEQQQDMSTIVQELSNSTTTTYYRKCSLLVAVSAIPACGYLTLYLQEGQGQEGGALPAVEHTTGEQSLENAWLKLTVSPTGELTLLDKRSQQTYQDILRLTDGGDAGDNYNYSPPKEDWVISNHGSLQQKSLQTGPLLSRLTLDWQIPVPANRQAREQRLTNATLPVSMTLTLATDNPYLDIALEVDNQIQDHRLQILLPTGVQEHVHFADQPFGLIQRDNLPAAMVLWQQEGWNEAPVALYPMQSLVMMHNAERGLAVVTEGLREYQIPEQQQDVLAITLLRSVGWLGLADMPYRPGRASGMILPAPESQIPGIHHFHLAVLPLAQGADNDFWQQVEQWRTPLRSYIASGWSRFRTNALDKKFPSHYSLINWQTPLHFSTLKKAQHSDALVIRAWNPSATPMVIGQPSGKVEQATLDEKPVSAAKRQPDAAQGEPVTFIIYP